MRPHPEWASTSYTFDELTSVLCVPVDPDQLQAELVSVPTEHGGILGAQLLGQMVTSCEAVAAGKVVSTMRMSFLRPSTCRRPARMRLRRLSDGRRYGVLAVDIVQDDRLVARGEALMTSSPRGGEGQFSVSHRRSDEPPLTTADARALWPWDVRVGPAGHGPVPGGRAMGIWARVPGAAVESTMSRALLAFATESLLIPLAIDVAGRRGDGGRMPQAVLSHSVTFTGPAPLDCWHRHEQELVAHVGQDVAGRGRVVAEDGTCLATTETVATLTL